MSVKISPKITVNDHLILSLGHVTTNLLILTTNILIITTKSLIYHNQLTYHLILLPGQTTTTDREVVGGTVSNQLTDNNTIHGSVGGPDNSAVATNTTDDNDHDGACSAVTGPPC